MTDFETLIEILEAGLEKHGEKPLTNRWLLNIIKAAEKNQEHYESDLWSWAVPDDIF